MSLLAPIGFATIGLVGNPSVNNKLVVTGASVLAVSGSYSGAAYVLNGPADVGAAPVQLGFKRGDKLRLQGAAGTEPNHGRELTLSDPSAISVFETLVSPDANEYQFTVFRRSRGRNLLTLAGLDSLTQLLTWSVFGTPDIPFTAKRLRWVGVGSGSQLEARGVTRLVFPLQVAAGVYLKTLNAASTVFPTITSVSVKTVFTPAEITYAAPAVVVSEAGLFFDAWMAGSGSLTPASAGSEVGFYRAFEPLVKLNSFSLDVLWELQL